MPAGIIATGSVESTTDEEWAKVMDINLHAPFRLMRAAAAALTASGGSIVNVSSVNGLRSFPGLLAYCVSKSALDHLTRCAALELAPKGVRVNAVNPGVTVSNLHRRGGMAEEAYAGVPGAIARDASARPAGPAGGDRRRDLLPGVGCRQVDDRRDHPGRRRPPPHLRALAGG